MQKYKKIIFVCSDNTCLSVIAEAIMNSMLMSVKELEGVSCISSGLVVLLPEPINSFAKQVLLENGLTVPKDMTKELSKSQISADTLVLTMTAYEKNKVRKEYEAIHVYTLCEFVGQSGEIERPYGGTKDDYERLYEKMDLFVKLAVRRLRSETVNM